MAKNRAVLVLVDMVARARAHLWVDTLPVRSRVEFKEPRRTLPQNARMWAMLTDISEQMTLFDQYYTPDEWKCIFLHAIGRHATKFLPSLYGEAFIPYGQSSSDISIKEMSEMIEQMFAF